MRPAGPHRSLPGPDFCLIFSRRALPFSRLYQGTSAVLAPKAQIPPKRGKQDNGGVTRQPLRACRGRHSRHPVAAGETCPRQVPPQPPLAQPASWSAGPLLRFCPNAPPAPWDKNLVCQQLDAPPGPLAGQTPVPGRRGRLTVSPGGQARRVFCCGMKKSTLCQNWQNVRKTLLSLSCRRCIIAM